MRDVVITGFGVVSPIGIGRDAFAQSLNQQRCGIVKRGLFNGQFSHFDYGGMITDFEPKEFVKPRKSLKVMCREIQTGYSAAILAMTDANLQSDQVQPERLGVVFGAELFFCPVEELALAYQNSMVDGEFDFGKYSEQAMNDLYPLWMLKHLPNMVACHVGISQDARGPNNTITLGEASGALAMAEGAAVIERGDADVIITGGAGTRVNIMPLTYRCKQQFERRYEDPAKACRPFDATRDWVTPAEGAGSFILESREFAQARSARILARVAGYGRTSQTPQTGPQGAIENSIRIALEMSGMKAGDVGFVSAAAQGSQEDKYEAAAIAKLLGDVPVVGFKSYFGNAGAGAASLETAATLLALESGEAAPTLNYTQPDPECPVNVVHGKPLSLGRRSALVLSHTYSGQATAVMLVGE